MISCQARLKIRRQKLQDSEDNVFYLNQHLLKYKPWPTKEEAPLAVKGKESTSEKARADHEERETCQPTVEEGPIEKGHEAPLSPEVKRCKTGNNKAYLAMFK
jgi:hypothetical protein